jgi:xylan 1,4-beta-xylosidase
MTFSTALFTPKRAPVPAPLPDTQPHKQFASVNGVAVESFRNPIVPGDHPDPAVLKDGADYYMTCSSGQCYPGAVIWHSRDLVNWVPCVAALNRPVGVVRAMDLVKHDGRYFLYIPVQQPGRTTVYVIHADDIRGPWSAPIDLCLDGCLGCGHAVGDDGVRHLFVNGDTRVRLTDDGLATVGARMAARVGDNPAVMPSAGSQVMRHGDFFYSVTATDGTDGSPGGHITVSRSRSLTGHWERCPFDPIGNAEGADGSGWTRGRAALVQGPAGDWWMVCHGFDNSCRPMGRQLLLESVEWTRDGWFRLSDDFTCDRLGLQWRFFDPAVDELQRARYDGAGLLLQGKGRTLSDCSPLTCVVSDRSYAAEIEFEPSGVAQGGLALFHDARGFVGLGIGEGCMRTYNYGKEHPWMQQPVAGRRHRLKVTYRRHLITFHHAADDGPWTRHPWLKDASGLHQNVLGDVPSLRLALFAAGHGDVRLQRFTYRPLPA